ncbi:MAG: bifunctional glutamine synthetase adenylyltransferase/deadenyltransferase, partial [Gammaproteobacteria bacterium]
MKRLPEAVQQRVIRDWQTFQQRGSDEHKAVLEQLDEQRQQELVRAWGFSEFVAKQCSSNPALFAELVRSNDLWRRYPDDYYTKTLRHELAQISSEAQLHQSLRRFRNREMV